MVAKILNVTVDIPKTEEGPSMGGAMLAMVACGVYSSVEEACKAIVEIVGSEEPDKELTAKYENRYQAFKKLYPACKSFYDSLKLN